jgi:hypothetical protein
MNNKSHDKPRAAPVVLATSAAEKKYDFLYYVRSALAGGICCAITHGAMTPVDVVKTRIQLDPVKYNRGLVGGFAQVVAEEGTAGLATGLGPTVVGYFVQGRCSCAFVCDVRRVHAYTYIRAHTHMQLSIDTHTYKYKRARIYAKS